MCLYFWFLSLGQSWWPHAVSSLGTVQLALALDEQGWSVQHVRLLLGGGVLPTA